MIDKAQLLLLLSEARREVFETSEAVRSFREILKNTDGLKALCERFKARDVNGDGSLKVDGVKAALLGGAAIRDGDYNLDVAGMHEIFNLACNDKDGEFYYIKYITSEQPLAFDYFPNHKMVKQGEVESVPKRHH